MPITRDLGDRVLVVARARKKSIRVSNATGA
jgi:hypothetical protein